MRIKAFMEMNCSYMEQSVLVRNKINYSNVKDEVQMFS